MRSATDGSGGDILVIEDDDEIRAALCEVLSDEGYSVREASNGLEALQLLRSGALPALLILDLMMPVMDGWQFCAEKNRDAELAPIPVLVLSANGQVEQRASGIGAAVCISKPVRLHDLLAAVARFYRS